MKILGVEIEYSFTNGDNVKKFEDNYEIVTNKISSFNGKEKLSEVINGTCEAIDLFFDKVFGDGTAKKLFKGNELKDRFRAFKELKEARDTQEKEYEDLLQVFTSQTEIAENKYSSDRTKR